MDLHASQIVTGEPAVRPPPVVERIDAPRAQTPRQGRRRFVPRRQTRTGILFHLPMLLVLVAITAFPIAYSANLSFRSYSLVVPSMTGQWIGLDNYTRLLGDGEFWNAMRLTLLFV